MTPRFHTSRPDRYTVPRQSRWQDFGHGRILSALEDDTLWSCIRSGLGWTVAAVWAAATAIAVIVAW